jgi:integrase
MTKDRAIVTRRRRSTGSVSFHKASGLWVYRFWAGGKRINKYASDRKTAEERLARELVHVADGGSQPSRMTLSEWAKYWLSTKSVAPSTLVSYETNLRHLTASLGGKKLSQITSFDLESVYAGLLKSGLSPTSVNSVHRTARNTLGDAHKRELTRNNVAAFANAPRPVKRNPVVLSRMQWRELVRASRQVTDGLLVELLLKTGLRVDSEALNLRWRSVNLESRRLTVEKSKTTAGTGRVIPLETELAKLLKLKRANQIESSFRNGVPWDTEDFVFATSTGRRKSLSNLRVGMFAPLVSQTGINDSIRFHDLRHNCGSLLLSEGIPITTVSKILGHANVSITLSIYAHQLPDDVDRVSEAISGIFNLG